MDPLIFNKLIILQKRFRHSEQPLNQSKTICNQKKFSTLSKQHAKLFDIIKVFEHWLKIQQEIETIKEMLTDVDMQNMVQDELRLFYTKQKKLEENLNILLSSKDSHDKYNSFVEIRAGTGGKEAAIFAGELFRMYVRYVELHKWNIEIIHANYSGNGGYKEIITKISGQGNVYGQLKFESGGHRVQRIPYTESQGRIHTSTCTIAVIPEIPNTKLPNLHPNDLRIDTFRASGAGGQHVNTTDSAIRIIHIPTGLTVECQDERSQHKNKAKALSVLSSRLYSMEVQRRQKEESFTRRNLIGTGERSNRIRTYNFQHGRVTDHRISFTSYKLTEIMNGYVDILIKPMIRQHQINLLNELLDS